METETAQDWLRILLRFADKVHPQHPSPVADEAGEFQWGDIGSDGMSWLIVKGANHGDLWVD
ncbi:MAG: hypothetical protein JETCAE01_04890 [Anaerolineaceae bacterium]|nr:MAG: hypothetical protein JETCAE01_04890 [Anaerolineaceae bacterium]